MKSIRMLAIGLCFGAILRSESAPIASAPAESDAKVFTTSVRSGYTEDDGQRFYKAPVSQTEINVELGHGFYFNDWFSSSLTGKTTDASENEASLGYSTKTGGVDPVTIDAWVSYYDLATLWHGPKDDLYVATLKLSREQIVNDGHGKLAPAFEAAAFRSGRGSEFGNSWRLKWSAEYTHQLFSAELSYVPAVVYDSGTYGAPKAWVTSHEVSLSWKVGKLTVKAPQVTIYAPLSSHSGRELHAIGGISVSL